MSRPEIRNVLLLTVDALKTPFLLRGGNPLNVCPAINLLAENGLLSLNCRTHGFPTQMAFPPILSGTLPLDHGGYDSGITGRPLTLAEALLEAGLETTAFSSSPWLSRSFGYDRGFDRFYEIFDINKSWKIFSLTYGKYYADLLSKEVIGPEEYVEMAGKWFEIILAELERLSRAMLDQPELAGLPYRPELHRHNLPSVISSLDEIRTQYTRDPGYLLTLLRGGRLAGEMTMLLEGRPPQGRVRARLTRSADHLLKLFLVQVWQNKYSSPASYYTDRILSALDDRGDRPFFIWTHFLDIHDHTYTRGPVGLPPDPMTLIPARLLTRNNPASMVRTLSLRYIDKQVSRILKGLASRGILDRTLIVLCGDHGYPVTSKERMAGNLFDESARVPLIFYNPRMERRIIDEPGGLIDIAPTVLDLMGLEPRPGFLGISLAGPVSGDRPIIMENLGPGPADFRFKAAKIGVVRGRFKLVWREPGYERSSMPGENYLFDLAADPLERTNLYQDARYRETAAELEAIALQRCEQIRSGT